MSILASTATGTIASKEDLIAWFASGCKPKEHWRVGTEHEKFAYRRQTLSPIAYDGAKGLRAVLEGMAEQFGWQPVYEDNLLIALRRGEAGIDLEPGGQVELSGAPVTTVHETLAEMQQHLTEIKAVAGGLDIDFMGIGFHPLWRRDEVGWVERPRNTYMRDVFRRNGTGGVDMMARTTSVQVHVDYASEADMVQKFRTSLALQPLTTALFANSPFLERQPSGNLSHRGHIWNNTDSRRCGTLPFVFEQGFCFERYVDYLLDLPMYYLYRNGHYQTANCQPFRVFLEGNLEVLPGEKPTWADWQNHVAMAFPQVRLKKYLEIRGADGGRWQRVCIVPALWAGLLYDADSLAAAADVVKNWTVDDHLRLTEEAPRLGFKAKVQGVTLLDIGRQILPLAAAGLQRRACLNAAGQDESHFLTPLLETLEKGITPAEELLAAWEQNKNLERLILQRTY